MSKMDGFDYRNAEGFEWDKDAQRDADKHMRQFLALCDQSGDLGSLMRSYALLQGATSHIQFDRVMREVRALRDEVAKLRG